MDKISSLENSHNNESLIITSRKTLKLEGIKEINNSSETCINVKMKDTTLNIVGSNLHIVKLDVNAEILEAEGNFESVKYGKSTNIFKRIFK